MRADRVLSKEASTSDAALPGPSASEPSFGEAPEVSSGGSRRVRKVRFDLEPLVFRLEPVVARAAPPREGRKVRFELEPWDFPVAPVDLYFDLEPRVLLEIF